MCGNTSGCGSVPVSRSCGTSCGGHLDTESMRNVDKIVKSAPTAGDFIEAMIDDHKKAIVKLTKLRSLIKTNNADEIKKAIKNFVDKM